MKMTTNALSPSAPASRSIPIFLLPGLGLDERLYSTQKVEFPGISVPPWLRPRWGESLPKYAERMAAAVNPGGPCYVGGMSFGGMVALEMSRHLDCRGCFLISSLRSAQELPGWAKFLSPWAWVLPPRSDLLLAAAGATALWTIGRAFPPRWQQFCLHLSRIRAPLMPWALRAVVSWKPSKVSCPVFQIHGDRDPIFPHGSPHPGVVIPRGGHFLPLSHPFAISDLLRGGIQASASSQG